jgi:hypothetical protein
MQSARGSCALSVWVLPGRRRVQRSVHKLQPLPSELDYELFILRKSAARLRSALTCLH